MRPVDQQLQRALAEAVLAIMEAVEIRERMSTGMCRLCNDSRGHAEGCTFEKAHKSLAGALARNIRADL